MKKVFAVLCLFAVTLTLCACSSEEQILIATNLEDMSIRAVRGGEIDEDMPSDYKITDGIWHLIGNAAYLDESIEEPLESIEAGFYGKEWQQTVKVPRGTKQLYVEPVVVGKRIDIEDVIIDLLDKTTWENYDFKVKDVTESETDNRDVITVAITNKKDEQTKLGKCDLLVDGIKNESARNQASEKYEGCSELIFEIVKRPYGYKKLELVIDTVLTEGTQPPIQKVIIE